jgi:hypothetical protein
MFLNALITSLDELSSPDDFGKKGKRPANTMSNNHEQFRVAVLDELPERRSCNGGLASRRVYRMGGLSAWRLRNLPPSEHSALGCRSVMSASIAMRLVGYTRVAIICQRPSGMLARSYDRSSEQSAQNCTSTTKTAVVLGRRNECSPRAPNNFFARRFLVPRRPCSSVFSLAAFRVSVVCLRRG